MGPRQSLDLRTPPVLQFKRIGRHRAHGLAYVSPTNPQLRGTIKIDRRLKGRRLLEVIMHELIHQVYPAMEEVEVTRLGRFLALCLYSWGIKIDEDHLWELVEQGSSRAG